jgi:hypothetical protein
MGLATNIKNAEIRRPIPINGKTLEGKTRSPKVRNRMICISQA